MSSIEELLRRLDAAKSDTLLQAAIAAESVLLARPESERQPLHAALDAGAVLRWFDVSLLGKLLEVPDEEARTRFEVLTSLPFVERYRMRDTDLHNIHEATRLGWRKKLADETPALFRSLSVRAAEAFADEPTPAGRIEWIYHLLCGDPDFGATELEKLNPDWSSRARPEERSALAAALRELEDSRLVAGRARAWTLLITAWAPYNRGEITQLADTATEALRLAREAEDRPVEAEAQCLLGDVRQAQGNLDEAQAAFGEYLTICRRLAEQDPSNTGWQRELAVAYSRVGEVLQAQGKLEAAQAVFGERLSISRRLVERDPNNAGWQRGLAVAHNRVGGVLEAQGKLEAAQAALGESLSITRRLAEQDPSNAGWQRELAVAHRRVGDVLRAQGKLEAAQAALGESLSISQRLVEQDPSNAGWQRELAVAHSRVGGVWEAQGKLEEAQAAFGEYLTLSRRLAEQDPSNAGWQRELAVAHSRVGGVLQGKGKLDAAQAAFGEYLTISRRLAEQDPSNAGWQRDLAVAHSQVGGCSAGSGPAGRSAGGVRGVPEHQPAAGGARPEQRRVAAGAGGGAQPNGRGVGGAGQAGGGAGGVWGMPEYQPASGGARPEQRRVAAGAGARLS